jgi:hypothetical protein
VQVRVGEIGDAKNSIACVDFAEIRTQQPRAFQLNPLKKRAGDIHSNQRHAVCVQFL